MRQAEIKLAEDVGRALRPLAKCLGSLGLLMLSVTTARNLDPLQKQNQVTTDSTNNNVPEMRSRSPKPRGRQLPGAVGNRLALRPQTSPPPPRWADIHPAHSARSTPPSSYILAWSRDMLQASQTGMATAIQVLWVPQTLGTSVGLGIRSQPLRLVEIARARQSEMLLKKIIAEVCNSANQGCRADASFVSGLSRGLKA